MKCTEKEIAEKRRQALAKLAKRKFVLNFPKQITNYSGVDNAARGSFSFSPNGTLRLNNSHHNLPRDNPPPSNTSIITPHMKGIIYLISEDRFEVQLPPSFSVGRSMDIFIYIISSAFDVETDLWNFHINDYECFQSRITTKCPNLVVNKLPNFVLNCCKAPKLDHSKICLSRIDPVLAGALMPFQEEGVSFAVAKNGRCLIADDKGVGKTFQALAIASYYKFEWPLLIATTSSMKKVWLETIYEYLPSVSIMDTHNMISEKDYIAESDVVIVNHELMALSLHKLLDREFGMIILDESHYLENYKDNKTIAATKLAKKARRAILLSGRPALSKPSELYSQLEIVDEGFFGNFINYSRRYCNAKSTVFGWDASGTSNSHELKIILKKHFMIRRTKDEILKRVSNQKREIVKLDVNLESLSLPDSACFNSLAKEYTSQQNDIKKHEALLNYFCETGRIKIPSVCSYILEILGTKKKFIVYAHHKEMLDAIEHILVKNNRLFIRIDEYTNSTQQRDLVHQFQEDDGYQCALLSIIAVARAGITVTAAKLVIFAELHWNPNILSQAESRAHKNGQKEEVHVRYLLASDTADDHIWALLLEKQQILQELGFLKDTFKNLPIVSQSSANFEWIANDINCTPTNSAFTLDSSFMFNTPSSSRKRRLSVQDSDGDNDGKHKSKRRLFCTDKLDVCEKDIPNSQDSLFTNYELNVLDDDLDEILSSMEIPK